VTSAEFTQNRENYCYRHPDRQSFVLCQRCMRTICPECQTQAPVGVICPECLKAQQQGRSPAQRTADRRWGRRRSAGGSVAAVGGRPLVTYWLIGISTAVYLTQLIPGSPVQTLFQFAGLYVLPSTGAPFEPWRMLTALFLHASFIHLALNMLALWMIGQSLEPLIGHWRYLTLYLISGLGGSVAVALLADPRVAVIGASGAIFGLFGALLVIGRHIGANITGIAIVIGINLVISFLPGFAIAWQAHVGGVIVGAAVGFVLARTRAVRQRALQIWLLAAIVVVLLVIVAVRAFAF
jgi:membrane associated rhomboid family serine protease